MNITVKEFKYVPGESQYKITSKAIARLKNNAIENGHIDVKTAQVVIMHRFAKLLHDRGYENYEIADHETKLICDGMIDAIDALLDLEPTRE